MTAFPQVQDDLTVEMNIGGTWTNVTSYIYTRDPLTISRGRADEASQVDPSRWTATLNNTDGRFSPRNPLGAYYGSIGRSTPLRMYVSRGGVFMELLGTDGNEASAPDTASLSITGDIDVRIDVSTSYWGGRNLCAKYKTTGNQRSWAFQVDDNGYLRLTWSSAGTAATGIIAASTMPIPFGPGRLALRVTLDVNNGASGNTTTFYTSDTISGTWTQLGDPIVNSGTTSIFDSTAPVEVGDATELTGINGVAGATADPVAGRVNAFQLLSGIGGTVVANPNFTTQTAGAGSFADTASPANTWTLSGGALLTNRRWRFNGEIVSLPASWNAAGTDVYVPVEADGLMRRLGQGKAPLRSPLYRGILTEAGVVAYWPGEDSGDARLIASGLPSGQPMTPSSPPGFAGSSVFEASESLPTVSKTSWAAPVPVYTPTSTAQVRFLLSIPSTGAPNNTVIMRILTTGTAARWDLVYTTGAGGSIGYTVYDADGNQIKTNTGNGPYNGSPCRFSFELTQSGSDINLEVLATQPGASGAGGTPDTVTGRTFARIKTIIVNPGLGLDDTTIGHISVHSQITSIFDLIDELQGWIGETAGRRFERLCGEEGITFRGIGDLDDTTPMGIQKAGGLLDLLRECSDADLGIMFEPREVLGLGYRTRTSLYNQTADVAINYANGELSDAPSPVDDDQNIRNSVTVSRTGGGSARVDIVDGPLSILDPPNGAGTYADQPSISLQDDGQCAYQASWRAHLGTVNEARYPVIAVNFAAQPLTNNPTLVQQLLEHEAGDRITISNLPSWLPPDPISQLAQGYTETFQAFKHDITINCAPESPYRIAVWGTDRYDTAGSALNASCTSGATSIAVKTTLGPIWTTAAGDMPFDIMVGGERMTVTAISGSSSPQTFTVVRSVNGLVKAHNANEDVRIYTPTYRQM